MSFKDGGRTLFLEAPYLVRQRVWKALEYSDHLSVRQVCKTFRNDIDFNIGLAWTITDELPGYSWFQERRVSKCVIKEMNSLKNHCDNDLRYFHDYPKEIDSLHFRPMSPVIETDILTLIQPCSNLVELKIQTENLSLIHFTEQILLEELLELVKPMRFLRKLTVILYPVPKAPYRKELKFYIEDESDISVVYIDPSKFCNCELSEVILEVPRINPSALPDWKKFLQRQRKLKTLICNFGLIFWGFYERTIEYNALTLEKVILRRVTGVYEDIPTEQIDEPNLPEIPFNWLVFSECTKLRYVKIVHDYVSTHFRIPFVNQNIFMGRHNDFAYQTPQRFLQSINFDCFPTDTIQQLYLRNLRVNNDHLEEFRVKAMKTPFHFRGKSNIYVDEDEADFLETEEHTWSGIPVHQREQQIDFRRLFQHFAEPEPEDYPNAINEDNDIPLLIQVLYFFISWFLFVFGAITGPVIILCMCIVAMIIP